MDHKLVLSCEHATAFIPAKYRHLFKDEEALLTSHQAFDTGAIEVAKYISLKTGCELHKGQVSRLVIDLNRSDKHPQLFSRFSKKLPPVEKAEILEKYYRSYREPLKRLATIQAIAHLSIHSFTGILHGKKREADIGLLYDPQRDLERSWAYRLRSYIRLENPGLRIRMNYPYKGTSDGFTRILRMLNRDYLGIEIEMNQDLISKSGSRAIAEILYRAIKKTHSFYFS